MTKEKVHGSFREMHNSIHNIAAPAAPERVAMQVAGNPSVLKEAALGNYNQPSYRKGGAVTPRAYHSDHHNYKVKGHR